MSHNALLLLLIILGATSFYMGFLDTRFNPFRSYSQTGFLVFTGLLVFVGYFQWMGSRGEEEISKYITPYPHVRGFEFLPRVGDNQIEHWLIRTADPVDAVYKFYQKPENHTGWELSSGGPPVLIFKKTDQRLSLSISEQGKGSTIYFNLTEGEG